MAKKDYFAKAGHLYVMSELLLQKWNVAMPEVDVGDDIFVVRDANNDFLKVQVKSSNIIKRGNRDTAMFNTSVEQLRNQVGTLIYFLVFRSQKGWKHIIIDRTTLFNLYEEKGLGGGPHPNRKNLILNFIIKNNKPYCNDINFSKYLNNWTEFKKREEPKELVL